MKLFYTVVAVSVLLLSHLSSFSQIILTQIATGFNKVTDIQHAGDERLFVLEQAGRIKIMDLQGNITATPFLDIVPRVYTSGATGSEQGLLGIAFSPDYANDGFFYVNYSNNISTSNRGHTTISRFSRDAMNPNLANPASEQILMVIRQPYSNHNGGCIQFGKDGYLYIGMGDGGSAGDPQNRSQNLDTLLGKMLRIDVSTTPYSIPSSNPFVGVAGRDEIWSVGLRNPWKFSFDKVTQDMWIADVGQNLWEEIDFQPASSTGGENYGWRCYEGNVAYNTAGCQPISAYDAPVAVYPHTGPGSGCSVSGGFVYRGAQYANMFGEYFFTDYCSGRIWGTKPNGIGGWTTTLYGQYNTNDYSTFGQDIYGELYIGGNVSGRIWKVSEAACLPVAWFSDSTNISHCGTSLDLSAMYNPALSYQWYESGNMIVGADSSVYTATAPGNYSVTVTNATNCTNNSTVTSVSFFNPPAVSFSGLDSAYCDTASSATLVGVPPGGTFSGPGVVGNTFDPGVAGGGTHSVTYTYTDINNCTNSASNPVVVDLCTGLKEYSVQKIISLYPNPSGGFFSVKLFSNKNSLAEFLISDVTGRQYNSRKVSLDKGFSDFEFDVRGLAHGIYFLSVRTSEGTQQIKFAVN